MLLIRHVAMGDMDDAGEKEVDDRLALHSLLEDGEYVRLVSEWVVERIQPTFAASFEAAGRGTATCGPGPAMPPTPSGSPTTPRP